MFDNIRRDVQRAVLCNQGGYTGAIPMLRELLNPGTQAIMVHRFGFWADHLRLAPLRVLFRSIHLLVDFLVCWRVGIFIPVKARIGPGLVIHTWGGGIFLPATSIGRDVLIVGGGVLMDYEMRGIGDEVRIGAGTKVVGKIRIGNRVQIAPNSVLHSDIPDDCVVFGPPARMIGPVPRKQPGGPLPSQLVVKGQ
jgi:serine O-acetyltransferase